MLIFTASSFNWLKEKNNAFYFYYRLIFSISKKSKISIINKETFGGLILQGGLVIWNFS